MIWVLLALFGSSGAPGAQAAQVSEAESVSHRLWDKLLTHCGSSYFYAGSVFDGSGMLSNVQVGHQQTVEYRSVRFHTVPIRVTDAERANGLTYRARISMIAHLYREGDGSWQDGPDLRPRNTDDILAKAISQANSDMFDMGGNGAMALELVKFKGTWAVTRSSTTLSGSLGYNDKYYDVDKVIAARVARYSCASASVVTPGPTAEELAAQESAKRKQEQAAQAFKDEQDRKAKVKAEGLSHYAFTGSIDEFSHALAANMTKRAVEFHLNPASYQPEYNRIMQMVQTCTAVTEAEWHKAWYTTTDRREQQAILHGCDGVDQNGSFGQSISPYGKPRAVQVDPHVSEFDPKAVHYFLPDYFTLNVYFDKANGDDAVPYEESFGRYVIISAKISRQQSTGASAQNSAPAPNAATH